MKKSLLALAAAILGVGSAMADTWGVIGGFNAWSDDVEMTEISEGVFSVTMESLEGDFKFRANHDWSVNLGADYVYGISGNASGILMNYNGSNFTAVGTLSNVTLTIDVYNSTLQVSGLSSDMVLPEPPVEEPALYIIGDPVGVWDPNYGVEMSAMGDGVYTWSGFVNAPAWFGFTSALSEDWNVVNAHRYGPTEVDQLVPVGAMVAMEYQKDASWSIDKSGEYFFTVDTKNLTFSASARYMEDNSWGMIGSFNDWGDDLPFTNDGDGKFSIDIESLSAGEQFKFRANADWAINFGSSDNNLIDADGVYGISSGGNNFVAGKDFNNVKLTLNFNDYTLTVSGLGASGVNDISSENEMPVFYNLQGLPVQNPQNGVFIRVANGKSSKVSL